ncbi:MAG: hypothetical protein MPW15_21775 [Candidatus Manganitrophus sp.]|nr:hypothetical protein [Candidatus Manganitrophus sp.]
MPIRSETRYAMFYIEQLIRDFPFFLFALFAVLFFQQAGPDRVGLYLLAFLSRHGDRVDDFMESSSSPEPGGAPVGPLHSPLDDLVSSDGKHGLVARFRRPVSGDGRVLGIRTVAVQ